MKNADYWRNRAEILEAAKNKSAGDYTAAVSQQFNLAQKTLGEQIEGWYGRFAKNNQITLAEARQWLTGKDLAEFKWDVSEYIQRGKDVMIDPAFMKQLENASARFHISKLEALKLKTQATVEQLYGQTAKQTTSLFGKLYADSYYHTAYTLQEGFGIGWDIAALNPHQIESVLSKPWTLDKQTFSDRIWKQKSDLLSEVHTQLTQNMILGKAPDDAIKAIAKKFGASKSNAGRLVMTESAYFAIDAQRRAFQELGVEDYEIVATLDSITSKICQSMDGKHFPMSQFVSGVTAPIFHPNCRSLIAPYFDDEDGGERVARGEDGKNYYVPAGMDYGEWKKVFVEGGPKDGLKSISKSGIIKQKAPFVLADTIKEAEEFARNVLGVQNVSYKGVDVATANAWNEGLQDAFDRFPELKSNFGFVGECHERNMLVRDKVRQYALDELIKLNPNVALAQLEPHADKYAQQYMTGNKLRVSSKTMAESWSPKWDVVQAFRGITVNRDYGKSAGDFVESLKQQVKIEFHPVCCDTIRSILDHEIGHQLDDLLGVSKMPDIQILFDSRTRDELTSAISRYAWDNGNPDKYSEMIAEAWSEYCNNPAPREIAITVGKAIESTYRVKFSAT